MLALLLALVLDSCDPAPRGVLGRSDMVDLLVDLHTAEAMTEMRPNDFQSDSARLALRQSVFAKHGITQAQYDSSLVWYAHHIEAYNEVYKKVLLRLNDEQKQLAEENMKASKANPANQREAHKQYPAKGDTANVWTAPTCYVLPGSLNCGYVQFELQPDPEARQGDRYKLEGKFLAMNNRITVLLAADYVDGSTALVCRSTSGNGWNNFVLQTDSTRPVRRVFGYLRYDIVPSSVAMVDSVSLVRTHLDRASYGMMSMQRLIDRTVRRTPAARPAPAAPEQHFKPKPGVNKGGVVRRLPATLVR